MIGAVRKAWYRQGVVRGRRAGGKACGGEGAGMRVATWNLWWRFGPWRERREPIAATLAEIDADLIGLQEVWGGESENFAAELATRLGRHWCWAVAATGRDGLSIGNAVLSR